MKHYKSVDFLSHLNVKSSLHKRKAPPQHKCKAPPIDGFLATVLHTTIQHIPNVMAYLADPLSSTSLKCHQYTLHFGTNGFASSSGAIFSCSKSETRKRTRPRFLTATIPVVVFTERLPLLALRQRVQRSAPMGTALRQRQA